MKKVVRFLLFLLLAASSLYSESVRGALSGMIVLSEADEQEPVTMGIGDLVSITAGENWNFISKAEITYQLPPAIREQADGFMILVYKRITPEPSENTRRYNGIEATHFVLPNRSRLYMTIPLESGSTNSNSVDSFSIESLQKSDFPLMITLMSLSKGVSPEVSNQELTLKITPEWKNLGAMNLSFNSEIHDHSSINLNIDGHRSSWEEIMFLTPGIHEVTINTPGYTEKTVNVSIEKAKISNLDVELEKQQAKLLFEAPNSTVIFLDGEQINLPPGTALSVEPGSHTVSMILNDYQLSKQFILNTAETLKITLFLDILIQDN